MRRFLALVFLLSLCGLTPAQRAVVLSNPYSQAACDRAIRASNPTAWLDDSAGQTLTAQMGASAWASRVGSISFAQATAAQQFTRTRADSRENRVLYSEDLSQATGWTPTRASVLNATEIKEDGTASNSHFVSAAVVPVVAGGAYNFVASVKRGVGTRDARLNITWPNATISRAFVNLTTGALSGVDGSTLAWTPTVSVDGDYFRVSGAATPATTGTAQIAIMLAIGGTTSSSYNGDNTSTIHATRIQLQSTLADPQYTPTADFPAYRGWNGRSVLRVDGGDVMTSAATLADIFQNNAKFAMLILRPAVAGASTGILYGTGEFWGARTSGIAAFGQLNYDGNSDFVTMPAATLVVNKPYLVTLGHDGVNATIGTNGGPLTSGASGNTSNMTGALRLGTDGGTGYWTGDLAELITWNRALSAAEIDRFQRCKARERGVDLQ